MCGWAGRFVGGGWALKAQRAVSNSTVGAAVSAKHSHAHRNRIESAPHRVVFRPCCTNTHPPPHKQHTREPGIDAPTSAPGTGSRVRTGNGTIFDDCTCAPLRFAVYFFLFLLRFCFKVRSRCAVAHVCGFVSRPDPGDWDIYMYTFGGWPIAGGPHWLSSNRQNPTALLRARAQTGTQSTQPNSAQSWLRISWGVCNVQPSAASCHTPDSTRHQRSAVIALAVMRACCCSRVFHSLAAAARDPRMIMCESCN